MKEKNTPKITPEQLKQLYDYVAQHIVFYDVQTELVDHIANGVEATWAVNVSVSFEKAVQAEIAKFGKNGLSKIVKQKRKALKKRYNQILWGEIKAMLTFKNILLFAALVMGVYMGITVLKSYLAPALITFFGALIVLGVVLAVVNKKRIQKRKYFLLDAVVMAVGSGFVTGGCIGMITSIITDDVVGATNASRVLFTIAVLLFSLVVYFAMYRIPVKADVYLKKQYNLTI